MHLRAGRECRYLGASRAIGGIVVLLGGVVGAWASGLLGDWGHQGVVGVRSTFRASRECR